MTSASRSLRPSSLRLATQVAARLSAAALLPLAAHAQQAGANAPAAGAALPTVTVQEEAIDPNPNAEVGAPYKARTSADVRHTKPLAETPATISVVTKSAIDDSGATDLKQILTAQPGITLGTRARTATCSATPTSSAGRRPRATSSSTACATPA